MSEKISIEDSDLPVLFQSADKASLNAQKKNIISVKVNLSLLCAAAFLPALAVFLDEYVVFIGVVSSIALIFSLFLTGVMWFAGLDQIWFGARAIAESVKTLAWRYMTCAEPYFNNLPEREVDLQFASDLRKVLEERKYLSYSLGNKDTVGEEISEKMRQVRKSPVEERKKIYFTERLEDQKRWYSGKANYNKGAKDKWFFAIALSQIIAFLSVICFIYWPKFIPNLTPFFAALASSFIAWLQVKQHQELVQSYNLASHELGFILAQEKHVRTDEDLSNFVLDSENAISREHTLWIARRDRI